MGQLTLFFIAIGLAMDAFAISVSNGICYKHVRLKEASLNAVTFGAFQAGMPLLGYYLGRTIRSTVAFLDHWIALGLLAFIGGTMIWDAVKELRAPRKTRVKAIYSFKSLMIQGVATSIDAFAIGISFAVIPTNIFNAVGQIGLITFLFSLVGVYLGKRFGLMFKDKAEIIGGIILIVIGLKLVIEHTIQGI